MPTCEKCGKSYPSYYYFATPTICKNCFEDLPNKEKEVLKRLSDEFRSTQVGLMRVGFGKRFLSAFVDTIIIITLILVIYKFNGFLDEYVNFINEVKESANDPTTVSVLQNEFLSDNKLNFFYPSLITLIYYLSEVFWGISLGKFFLGLKIANSNGTFATKPTLILRFIVKNSTSIIGLLWIITNLSIINVLNSYIGLVILFGFLLILTRNRQDLQDILAKTAVYKVEDLYEFNTNQ